MQKKLKGLMRKILIIFSLVCVLGLTFSVYADDLEESTDSSGDSVVPIELEDDFRRTAENLYLVISDNGTRATPHDVNDVYNLIVQIFYNQSNGSNEVVVIRQKLSSIDTACATIMSNVSSINTTLSNFYDSINPDYDQTGISIYDLIHTFYDSIFDIDGTDGDISLMELILVIEDEIENVELQLNSIISSVASIDSKCSSIISTLNTLNTNLINIYSAITSQSSLLHGDLDTINSNVNANMALIISKINEFENYYNNIDWVSYPNTINYYDNSFNSIQPQNITTTTKIYAGVNNIGYDSRSAILKIVFPIYSNYFRSFDKIQLIDVWSYLTSDTSQKLNYYIIDSYDTSYGYVIILYLPYTFGSSYQTYFHFNIIGSSTIPITLGSSISSYYLNQNQNDYYTILNYLITKTHYQTWKDLYASDDLIKAKEDQQDYEDDAINDFTGSGSAAASRGDLSNIKDVSTTIKQGLQTGGSVSNALSVFNSSGSFWGWFATQNYNDINNLSYSTNNRNGSSSEPEVIDFYTNNQFTLHGLLNGSY